MYHSIAISFTYVAMLLDFRCQWYQECAQSLEQTLAFWGGNPFPPLPFSRTGQVFSSTEGTA